jgi:hypothetical protein
MEKKHFLQALKDKIFSKHALLNFLSVLRYKQCIYLCNNNAIFRHLCESDPDIQGVIYDNFKMEIWNLYLLSQLADDNKLQFKYEGKLDSNCIEVLTIDYIFEIILQDDKNILKIKEDELGKYKNQFFENVTRRTISKNLYIEYTQSDNKRKRNHENPFPEFYRDILNLTTDTRKTGIHTFSEFKKYYRYPMLGKIEKYFLNDAKNPISEFPLIKPDPKRKKLLIFNV